MSKVQNDDGGRTVEAMAARLVALAQQGRPSTAKRPPPQPPPPPARDVATGDAPRTASEMRARWRPASAVADAAKHQRPAPKDSEAPCSPMMHTAARKAVEHVAVCLHALQVASRGAALHPRRRAKAKAEDRRHLNIIDMAATSAALIVRRAFSGNVPPMVRAAEGFAEVTERFAWFARERLRRLSFKTDFRLSPKDRSPLYSEGELEREVNAVRMHIEAEEQESLSVDELPHALPRTNADVFRRLVHASARYQSIPDGAINEAAPLLVWLELAVSRRAELSADDVAPTFNEALCVFARDSDDLLRTDHDGIARTALLSFRVAVGNYTAADRKARSIAKAGARDRERKRAG